MNLIRILYAIFIWMVQGIVLLCLLFVDNYIIFPFKLIYLIAIFVIDLDLIHIILKDYDKSKKEIKE